MTGRPTVLVVIKGLGVGGAEKLVSEGARFWDRERFDYRVVYQLPWKNQLVAALEDFGIPVECIGGRDGSSLAALRNLGWLARSDNADLMHAHLPSAGVMARLVGGAPIVYTEHNIATSYRQPTRLLNRVTYSRNRVVTAVSDAVASSLTNYPGPTPVVIPNGVDVTVTKEQVESVRIELGLESTDPLVVHVGNIRPHKGHETLIRAAVELSNLRPGVTIVSIGGEKHEGDLARVRAAAEAAGVGRSLRFLGRRADALAFVAAADVFVNPSDVEGLPVAILEAMALGTPVAATRVGGVPSVVADGSTGLLVEQGDATRLAAAVSRLLGDPNLAGRLARHGTELVEREYGLERMVRTFEDIYRHILDV